MADKIICAGIIAKCKIRKLFTDETGAVDIVAIVVLIGIVVLLAIVFKDELAKLIKTLFTTIEQNANDTVNTKISGNSP